MKHTRGGWYPSGTDVMVEMGSGKRICKAQVSLCYKEKISQEEARANARLIASAPDLLDTCKWVKGCIENMPKSSDTRSALIELNWVLARAEEMEERHTPLPTSKPKRRIARK